MLNAGLNLLLDTESKSAVWEQSRTLVILNYAAVSLAILITLWGARRIAERVDALRATTATVLDEDAASTPFREMNSVAGPLVAAGATAVVFAVTAFVSDGSLQALLRGTTWLVLGVAFWTFLWTYGSLALGLDRLGRTRLRPDAVRVDPGLGLRPLGDVAFLGLWLLLASLVPVLLTGLPDVVERRRRRRRARARPARVHALLAPPAPADGRGQGGRARGRARALRSAYAPVRAAPTLETLEQHRLLAAADALERRARAIHDWPLDEGTLARVITVATSVVAITIGRLILDPFGL